MAKQIILPNTDSLADYIANAFLNLMSQIQRQQNYFSVILSGGNTPIAVHEKIISQALTRPDINWKRIKIFFSDERCVPPDHKDSNYKMVYDTLIEPLNIPSKNVYRFDCEKEPQLAAKEYELKLQAIDLALLGLGTDGHTASLFPKNFALDVTDKLAVAVGKGPDGWQRVSLTYPALNNARHIWFMITGKEKKMAVQRLLYGQFDTEKCPARGVIPNKGELLYIIDSNAEIK